MVSEGVQTNGFNNGSGIPMPPHPGFSFQPLSKSAKTTSPIKMEFTSPGIHQISDLILNDYYMEKLINSSATSLW